MKYAFLKSWKFSHNRLYCFLAKALLDKTIFSLDIRRKHETSRLGCVPHWPLFCSSCEYLMMPSNMNSPCRTKKTPKIDDYVFVHRMMTLPERSAHPVGLERFVSILCNTNSKYSENFGNVCGSIWRLHVLVLWVRVTQNQWNRHLEMISYAVKWFCVHVSRAL